VTEGHLLPQGSDDVAAGTLGRPTVRVGLLGCGNVGSALARLLLTDAKRIGERTGVQLELVKVAVRSATKERDVPGVERLVTTDAFSIVRDPAIDVVVEVMGGISPARDLVLEALRSGKPVVSANKELLANHGGELWDAASAAGVDLLFEASVADPCVAGVAGG
jgi:homoserine dehydrogenase